MGEFCLKLSDFNPGEQHNRWFLLSQQSTEGNLAKIMTGCSDVSPPSNSLGQIRLALKCSVIPPIGLVNIEAIFNSSKTGIR